jgi:adenosylhomocysteine nucleosidase
MSLGVIAALEREARALRPVSEDTRVAVSGIGNAAAGRAATALIDAGAAALMTFGLAGGLDPRLAAGSIVIPGEVISPGGERFATATAWRERLASELGASIGGATAGGALLCCVDAIDSVAAKARAHRDTGAVAVDMESIAVARVAADHALPFLCVRVIVDTADDALPPAVVAASRAGRVRLGRLLAGLCVSPRDCVPLLRLALRYRTALRVLNGVGVKLGTTPTLRAA